MNRQLRRTRLMGIIALGLMAVGLWWFMLKPGFEQPALRETQIKSLQQKESAASIEYADLIKKAVNLPAAAADAKLLSGLLPPAAATAELDQNITAIAEANGISPNNVVVQCPDNGGVCALSPVPSNTKPNANASTDSGVINGAAAPTAAPTPAPTQAAGTAGTAGQSAWSVYQMKMSISATGSLEQLTGFVNGLNTSTRTLAITKVIYSPIAVKGVSSGVYSVTVDAIAYAVPAISTTPEAPVLDAPAKPAATATPKATASATSTPSK